MMCMLGHLHKQVRKTTSMCATQQLLVTWSKGEIDIQTDRSLNYYFWLSFAMYVGTFINGSKDDDNCW